jgi:hypothetical protein
MRRPRNRTTPLPTLYALLLIFLLRWGVGAQVSLAVPTWEAYDEPGHFAYAVTLATTGRLPERPETVRPTSAAETPERIQPPLYYALIALALMASGTDVSGFQYPETNPYFYFGAGNPNYALHREVLTPTQVGIERALRYSRLWSLLLTLPGVAFAYRVARPYGVTVRGWQVVALIVALIVSIWPQALFNGSMVTNDSLILTVSAAVTWLMLRVRTPPPTPLPKQGEEGESMQRKTTAIAWGVVVAVIGLGVLVKLNMILLLLPFAVLVLARSSRRQALRWLAVAALGMGGVLALLATSESIMLPFREVTHLGESMLGAIWYTLTTNGLHLIGDAFRYLLYSSVGLFGWGSVPLPAWLDVIGSVVAIGGVIMWLDLLISRVRRRERSHEGGRTVPYLLLALIIVAQIIGGLALVLFSRTAHVLNGRYMFPALSAFVLFYTYLGAAVIRRGGTLRRLYAVGGGLCILGLIVVALGLPGYLAAAYARPPAFTGYVATQRPYDFHPGARLIGYEADPAPLTVEGKRWVRVRLYWTATAPITTDYILRVELIGADGNGYGLYDSIPGNALHPTTNWRVGEVFADAYTVPLRSDAPPGRGVVRVSLLSGRTVVSYDLREAAFDVVP